MPTHIREARPDDLKPLTALMYDYVVGFYNNPWPGDQAIELLINNLLDQQIGAQFVAEEDGKLIGFATLFFTYSTMKAERVTIMNDLLSSKHSEKEKPSPIYSHAVNNIRMNMDVLICLGLQQ